MTDKIIIDGVDVAGCKNLYVPQESKICQCLDCETGEFVQCKREVDCYYKQLKHKQEECEKLKTQLIQRDDIDTFFNTPIEGWSNDQCGVCEYKGEYKQLKSENERLKEELDKLKGTYKPQNYDFIPYEVSQAKKEIIKYKQALDEIEEIAKESPAIDSEFSLRVLEVIKEVKDE